MCISESKHVFTDIGHLGYGTWTGLHSDNRGSKLKYLLGVWHVRSSCETTVGIRNGRAQDKLESVYPVYDYKLKKICMYHAGQTKHLWGKFRTRFPVC